jgi:hypothetical protein
MLKQLLAITFIVFSVIGNTFSQRLENEIKVQRPDFSGKWHINFGKSRFSNKKSPVESNLNSIVTIEQHLPALHVTMRSQVGSGEAENFFGGRFTLYTDGRGDNYIAGTIAEDSSTTRWEDDKLIVTFRNRDKQVVSQQEYELSSDRQTLFITWRMAEGVYGYNKDMRPNVVDDRYTEYMVLDRLKN